LTAITLTSITTHNGDGKFQNYLLPACSLKRNALLTVTNILIEVPFESFIAQYVIGVK